MSDEIRISEELRPSEPGMVDVTIDADARIAIAKTAEGRVRLTMRLPREAWPSLLGAVKTGPRALGTYAVEAGISLSVEKHLSISGVPCPGDGAPVFSEDDASVMAWKCSVCGYTFAKGMAPSGLLPLHYVRAPLR